MATHFSHSFPLPPAMPVVRATDNNDNNSNFISQFLGFSNYSNCYVLQTLILLYLPVTCSTHGVVGQFCGLYFTVQPAKLQLVPFPMHPINLRDIINILLISVFWSVL